MKKTIITGILFILFGYILGNIIFSNKIELIEKYLNKDTYYFLEQGIYYDEQIMETNIKNIKSKIIDHKKDKYSVYVGITKDKEIAEKLKKIYEKKNIKVLVKEKYLSSEEFSNNVDQFDILIRSSNETEEILTIEEVVLANYEEIIKNSVTK